MTRVGASLVARVGRRWSFAAGAALLALIAGGDDLGGAPTRPTSEFHFVQVFSRDGPLGRSYRGFGERSWTTESGGQVPFHLGVNRLTREYLDRAGLLMVDDFHGTYQWQGFVESMQRVFPDRPIL